MHRLTQGFLSFKSSPKGGLARFFFFDYFGDHCSIQRSSSPLSPKLSVGVHGRRMHLTMDQARQLSDYLDYFAREGDLPKVSFPVPGRSRLMRIRDLLDAELISRVTSSDLSEEETLILKQVVALLSNDVRE